jgi:hypothetical protein
MAMLTHDAERRFLSPDGRTRSRPVTGMAHLAGTKRACLIAATLLLAGGAMAAGIALKTAIYFSRYHLGGG